MANDNVAQILSAGGDWLPGIYSYSCTLEDIDSEDTQRNEAGEMVRNVIRKRVKKLSVAMRLTKEEVALVSAAIQDDTVDMDVFCPADPSAISGFVSAKFYVSKITTELMTLFGDTWWEVSFNAIEV